MEPFDLAQSFIERGENAASIRELARAFEDAVHRLGFRYFACCMHVDPLSPPPWAVMMHNYPASWADLFSERRLHEVDPVLRRAEQSFLPFSWDEPEFLRQLTSQQQRILSQGARFGLLNGYTIPLHSPWNAFGLGASCSVVPASRRVDGRSYFAVQLMAMYLYAAAVRMQESIPTPRMTARLTPRERQCLELASRGKSDWEIGQILRISEHTVHRHIESGKRRLGVVTRVQAIMIAVESRNISFGDAIRSNIEFSQLSGPDSRL